MWSRLLTTLKPKERPAFLPEGVFDFINRRLVELAGLVVGVVGLVFLLTFVSYDPSDPSWNTASVKDSIHNWMGRPGAYLSDLMLQTFGMVAFLVPLTLFLWGGRIFWHHAFVTWRFRILVFLVSMILLSIALAGVSSFDTPLGGSMGIILLTLSPHTVWLVALAGLAGLLCWLFSVGYLSIFRWPIITLPQRPEEIQKRAKKPKRPKPNPVQMLIQEDYTLPALNLLKQPRKQAAALLSKEAMKQKSDELMRVLNEFGVKGQIVDVRPGPVVTLYELEPAPGTKSSRVIGLSTDIARSMRALSVRIAVVPGQNAIGIELPNKNKEMIFLSEILESDIYRHTSYKIPMILGKNISGQPILADLAGMPHLLIAGTTGSGKSVGINTIILSLLYRFSPEKCRMIMIDPKMLELSSYDGIPHLLTPVVTDPQKSVVALKWAVHEMENRYQDMSKLGVRNIESYNARLKKARKSGEVLNRKVQTGFDPDTGKPIIETQPIDLNDLPYIVVIVDEFADLMMVAGKDIETTIQRLAQMARAAGIHLIMATQRPSVDVITGTIKANFPTRISFAVTSKIDSRTILGEGGAESLLGQGDMLYMASGGRLTRVHGSFVSDEEVEAVTKFLRTQGEPNYIADVTVDAQESSEEDLGSDLDHLYDEAVALAAREQKASTSFLQRHFKIGYNRSARIIEHMEKQGVISPANHVGKREVLIEQR